MAGRSNGDGGAPVTAPACITLRLLAWMLSTTALAAASVFFDAFAFHDMPAMGILLALVCATPFQRDAVLELALLQVARYQALGSGTKQ